MDAQQTRLQVISNNLANANTTGFKKSRAAFEDLIYQNIRQTGAQATQDNELPSGLHLGTGVRVVSTEKIHTQGNIVLTDNSLDIAIEGRGFFQILQPDGNVAYTRDGSFQLNSNGDVVTSGGKPIQPALNVPQNTQSISIGTDGTVSVRVAGQAAPQQIGNIQLADFVNPSGLEPVGQNLFLESGASGAAQITTPEQNGVGSLMQGSIETSNVNTVEELIGLIETQRSFEINSRAVSTSDEMLQYVTQRL
jgi:flagellar basal-body rod protein FlgG